MRRKKFFDDFFNDDDFDNHMLKSFHDLVEEMQKGFDFPELPSNLPRNGKPMVYGFSMRIGEDGKPVVQEFGNTPKANKQKSGEREPLVDVINGEKEVTIIAEIPGVHEKEVKTSFQEGKVIIDVKDPERKYYKEIALPKGVEQKISKKSLNNGILELVLRKK